MARYLWSATPHHVLAEHVQRGRNKTNIIPDAVDIEVDIRTIPGDDEDEVRRHLDKALGDLADEVVIEKLFSKPPRPRPPTRRSGTCSAGWWTPTIRAPASCRA